MVRGDQARWYLSRVGHDSARISIEKMPFRVGRDDSCDLQLESERASRVHAQITPSTVPNCLFLRDHQSTNGTYVNGVRFVEPVPVGHGDLLRFGEEDWTLESSDRVDDSPRPAATVRGVTLQTSEPSTTRRDIVPEVLETTSAMPSAPGNSEPI